MADEHAELLIGSLQSQFLRVRPTQRNDPSANDYWDGNWLISEIELAAGAFRAQFVATLRVDEFADFRDQLVTLYDALDGEATFDSMEEWLRIRFRGDGLGHFNVECQARDAAGTGNMLTFLLNCDQTQLPAILQGLQRVIERFPIIGTRDRY